MGLPLSPPTLQFEFEWRFLIHGESRARHRKAAEAFQVLADLYPDHYWAHYNLTYMLPMQGQYKEAFQHARRAAELRPQDFYAHNQAAMLVVRSGGSPAEARPYVESARELIPDDLPYRHLTRWILYGFPVYAAWIEDDLVRVQRELERLKEVKEYPGGFRSYRAFWHITLGQLEKAEELLAASSRKRGCDSGSIYLAWIKEDEGTLKELLSQCMGPLPMELPVINDKYAWVDGLFLRVGLLPPNQVRLEDSGLNESLKLSFEAELALASGRTDAGVDLLWKAFSRLPNNNPGWMFHYFWIGEALASTLEEQGRWAEAARALERLSNLRHHAYDSWSGAIWLRTQWHLSQLYHKLDLQEEAEEIESELTRLLVYADRDHPIRSRLPVEMAQARDVSDQPGPEGQ